jgi:hypothetical protein
MKNVLITGAADGIGKAIAIIGYLMDRCVYIQYLEGCRKFNDFV